MTSKTISVTSEIHRLLSRMKLPGESFSQAITRLARRSRMSECAGLWSGMPPDDLQDITRHIQLLRAQADEGVRRGDRS